MSAPKPMGPPCSPEARAQPITAMSSEEQNFHRLFPKVPQNEKLVESCQCGLTRKMLVRMGKLYLTSLRLCFQSSFLDESVMIPWEDVSNVEKKSSFMFDAIVVTNKLSKEDLSFTAFLGGGISQTHKLMKTLWSVRERYAASEAASLSRALLTIEGTDASDSSGNDDDDDDDNSSGGTDVSDFTEGVIGRRFSQSNRDELSFSGGTREKIFPASQSRLADSAPRGAGSDGEPLAPPSPITLANDPITGGTKRGRQVMPTPSSPTLTKPPTDDASALTQEVRSLFPNLPQTENVADSFQCSCVSGVHRLGKMYITQSFILFASVMMEENLRIAFEDVESIEKEQTMMILDGIALRIRNAKRAISFTSFVSRDAVYNSLMFFFKAVKKEKAPDAEEAAATVEDGPLEFRTKTSEYDRAKIPSVASLDEFSGVKTDWGSAFSDYACFTKELIKPTEMPAGHGVLDVFRICFDDKTPLLAEYHAKRNDSAQNCEDWRATTDGQPFRGQRQFTCTTLVKAMMGKACPYTEYQRYAFFNVGGTTPTLLVQFSSQISGVMFSDAFRAEALVVFTQAGSGEAATVTMRAYGYVQFLRSVWVKGKIQSKTLDDELPASYGTLATMIKETLKSRSGRGRGNSSGDGSSAVAGDGDDAQGGGSEETGKGEAASGATMATTPFRPLTIFGICAGRMSTTLEDAQGEGGAGLMVVVLTWVQLAVAGLVLIVSLYGVLVTLSPLRSASADVARWASLVRSVACTLCAISAFAASQVVMSLYLNL